MSTDDELERRLRSALTRPVSSDRTDVDVDAFLSSVHRGATVRRVRRGVSIAAAAALVVAGGGVAVNAAGLLSSARSPVASQPNGLTHEGPTPTRPDGSTATTLHTFDAGPPVPIIAHSAIPAKDVQPVSLTATGTAYQWVLAQTPGRDCHRPSCATVFATGDHGTTWKDLGQLPAPPATSDNPRPASVSQVRFAARSDGTGIHDGWAYGGSLWSTHDDGHSWSNADSPAGHVTALEAWGGYVYAAVSSPLPGGDTSTLYRSPTTTDSWQPVDLGISLTSVQALAAAKGVVGLIDSGGLHSTLYVSHDGSTWQAQHVCPAGTDPQSLSTAGDSVSGVGSLWVACTSARSTVIEFMDTNAWGRWSAVQGTFGGGVMVAASSPRQADVAGAGVSGIEQVSSTALPVAATAPAVGPPVYFGFTNATHGYLLDSRGQILATTDGGATWTTYAVSGTTP